MVYKFGKKELATRKVGNKLFISRLDIPASEITDKVFMTDKDAICFVFTSLESVDTMINDLKNIKKNMYQVKLKKLMEAILCTNHL